MKVKKAPAWNEREFISGADQQLLYLDEWIAATEGAMQRRLRNGEAISVYTRRVTPQRACNTAVCVLGQPWRR